MTLLERLNGDGVSIAYVCGYLMCNRRMARLWLIEHGAKESNTTVPRLWRIPSLKRRLAADEKMCRPMVRSQTVRECRS